jgi:hypothetical protein
VRPGDRARRAPSPRGDHVVTALAGDVDWSALFAAEPTRSFHCGGIFAGLSEETAALAEDPRRAAREAGADIVGDYPNLRPLATSLRAVHSASSDDRGICLVDGQVVAARWRAHSRSSTASAVATPSPAG